MQLKLSLISLIIFFSSQTCFFPSINEPSPQVQTYFQSPYPFFNPKIYPEYACRLEQYDIEMLNVIPCTEGYNTPNKQYHEMLFDQMYKQGSYLCNHDLGCNSQSCQAKKFFWLSSWLLFDDLEALKWTFGHMKYLFSLILDDRYCLHSRILFIQSWISKSWQHQRLFVYPAHSYALNWMINHLIARPSVHRRYVEGNAKKIDQIVDVLFKDVNFFNVVTYFMLTEWQKVVNFQDGDLAHIKHKVMIWRTWLNYFFTYQKLLNQPNSSFLFVNMLNKSVELCVIANQGLDMQKPCTRQHAHTNCIGHDQVRHILDNLKNFVLEKLFELLGKLCPAT